MTNTKMAILAQTIAVLAAACLLTDAPGSVSAAQLKELNIRLREQAAS